MNKNEQERILVGPLIIKMRKVHLNEPVSYAQSHRSILVLILLIPCLTAVVFGGADVSALIFLSPLIVAVGIIWIAKAWRSGTLPLNRSVLLLPVIGLTAIACVQLLPLGSANVSSELLSIPASATLSLDQYATRMFLVRLVGYLIFFAACLTFVDLERRVRIAVNTIIIFGGILAFAGILQKLASPASIYGVRDVEQAIPFGPFVNQHHFAALMVMTSGLAVARILDRTLKPDTKLLFGFAALIMLIALLMTSSRGGVISYLAMLGIVGLFGFRQLGSETSDSRSSTKPAVIVAVIALVIVIAGSVVFLGGEDALLRAIGFPANQTDVTSGRLHFWSVAWQVFAANPVIGAGFDAFGVAFTRYDTWNGTFRVEQAHNDYLQMLADGGVLAFACVVAFVFLFVRKSTEAIAGSKDFVRAATVGALAGCVGVLVHSFFDFPLRTPANAFFFLLLVSIAVGKSDAFRRLRESSSIETHANS